MLMEHQCLWEVVSMRGGSIFMRQDGFCIQNNETRRVEGEAVIFPHEGQDEVLWLIRCAEPYPHPLARRENGRVRIIYPKTVYEERIMREDGLFIAGDSDFIHPGDGFVILPVGTLCDGGYDYLDGRPRPMFYARATGDNSLPPWKK